MRRTSGEISVLARWHSVGSRYLWAVGGQTFGQAAAVVNIVVIARTLGLSEYGRYVVLLVALAAGTFAWNSLVLEAVANAFSRDLRRAAWDRYLVLAASAGAAITIAVALWAGGGGVGVILAIAITGEAFFVRAKPRLIADGRQSRIALGTAVEQSTRVAAVVILAAAGWLSPATAVVAQTLGYLAGAVAHGRVRGRGTTPLPPLRGVIGAEVLRWLERYPPLLGAAAGAGLAAVGGFDLLLRMLAFGVFALQTTGVVVLPEVQRGIATAGASLIPRVLRLPTVLGLLAAVGFAVSGDPAVRLIVDGNISLGWTPVALAAIIVVAPFTGIARVTLHACAGHRWILPSQAALAIGAVLSAGAMAWGLMPAAVLLAAGHIAGAWVLLTGLRSAGFGLRASELVSPRGVAGDLRRLVEVRP